MRYLIPFLMFLTMPAWIGSGVIALQTYVHLSPLPYIFIVMWAAFGYTLATVWVTARLAKKQVVQLSGK